MHPSRLLLLLCLLLPVRAPAAPMVTPSVAEIPVGQTVAIDLFLEPDGVVVGAYQLAFSVSSVSALRIDGVDPGSLPADCGGSQSGPSAQGDFSYAAECDSGYSSPIRVGTVTLTGLVLGGELRLDLSNATDSGTLEDVAIAPAVLSLVVVPEPGTIGLTAAGFVVLLVLRRRRSTLHLAIVALGLALGPNARAATLTTARSGGDCVEMPASGSTPKTYQMAGGQTCQITFSVALAGGTDVASALRADVGLVDPANAFGLPAIVFGGSTWGPPQSSFDGETFSVSVLSENLGGDRPFAVATLQADASRQGILSIVLDDLILGRDIDDPPFIVGVPFTPANGSTFALVVVPEPGTLALLALGLAVFAVQRRR